MLRVAENYGFRLGYSSDKKHADLAVAHNQGVLFSDKLDEIAEQIAKKWVHGSYNQNYMDRKQIRVDYYFNGEGDFAEVLRDKEKKDMPVSFIDFVNINAKGLEKTVRGFSLPFDKEQVRTG